MHKKKLRVEKKSEDTSALSTLSRVNGCIHKMDDKTLHRHLKYNGLSTAGCKNVLYRRAKWYYKEHFFIESGLDHMIEKPAFAYYVVIDFEATCEEDQPDDYLNEIIEFPAVLCNSKTGKIVDTFQRYCKPTFKPQLSKYCQELTGITQAVIDIAPLFHEVLQIFEDWLETHGLLNSNKVAFITDGSADFSLFLNVNCTLCEIEYPEWAKKWVNLKKVFTNYYKLQERKLADMLEKLGLDLEGRLHSGMDDTNNLTKIVLQMLADGACFHLNERLCDGSVVNIINKPVVVSVDNFPNRILPASDENSLLAKFNQLCI